MKRAAALTAAIVAGLPAGAAALSIVPAPPEPRSVVVAGAGVERRWGGGDGDTGLRLDVIYDRFFAKHRLSLGLRLGAFLGEDTVPLAGLRLVLWSYNPQRDDESGGRLYLATSVAGWRSADSDLDLAFGLETGIRMWFGRWIVDLPIEVAAAPLASGGTYSFHTGLRLGRSF